jgi:hypothetical protein
MIKLWTAVSVVYDPLSSLTCGSVIMEYRGIQYHVVQMIDGDGYKWTVQLNGGTKIGLAPTRLMAVHFAEAAIERALKRNVKT